jgi:hypothetical protein
MILSFKKGVRHFRKIQEQELISFQRQWNQNTKRRLGTKKKGHSIQVGDSFNFDSSLLANDHLRPNK